MINYQDKIVKRLDITLLATAIITAIYGLFILYGASIKAGESFFRNQIIWFILSLLLLALFSFISYKQYRHYIIIAYVIDVLLLLAVLFIGKTTMGAQRWIDIGFFKLQPSEFTKIIVIIALAAYLSEKKGVISSKDILISMGIVGLPMMLIFVQPDLGTAMVLLVVWVCLILLAGINAKQLATIAMIGLIILLAVFQLNILQQYQINRLLVFINPDMDPSGAGYNLTQSKIAVGSGGLTGKGIKRGSQTNLDFIPEAHTDFIFAVLGEKVGFVGALLLLGLYLTILIRGIRISLVASSFFGSLVSLAIVSMWLFQILVNVGMTIGIMPITGIPLPFLSYGGSSLFTNMASTGILLSVYSQAIK